MCSLNDNDIDEEIPVLEEKEANDVLDGVHCQKCNVNKASIKLRGKDVYCQSCFQISVTHKFRATLGKSKIVRPNDKVLVAHSGNYKSTVLLHLIKAGMHESVHKRLVFHTKVVYIDDGMTKNRSIDERQSIIHEIEQQIKPMKFNTFVVSLSESLDDNKLEKINTIHDYSCTNDNLNDKQLTELFNNLKSETSKEDMLKKLRHRVIIKAAKLLGCNKIFFADDSMSLSICILTNVSLGRGAQLSLDVGFIDNRYGNDLLIMRPLRDFSRHEVNYYLNIHNIKIIDSIKSTSTSNSYKSIRQLTENFITDLDSQFNGTVSTIFRVSEKVSAVAQTVDHGEICILCDAPLDTSDLNDITSAIKATTFSKLISSGSAIIINDSVNNLAGNLGRGNSCGNCVKDDCMSNNHSDLSLEEIFVCLCYGCRLIFNDKYSYELLPRFLVDKAKEQICLKSMRKEITNFLI